MYKCSSFLADSVFRAQRRNLSMMWLAPRPIPSSCNHPKRIRKQTPDTQHTIKRHMASA